MRITTTSSSTGKSSWTDTTSIRSSEGDLSDRWNHIKLGALHTRKETLYALNGSYFVYWKFDEVLKAFKTLQR